METATQVVTTVANNQSIWLALIAAVVAISNIVSPLWAAYVTNRAVTAAATAAAAVRRQEKQEDEARIDLLADRQKEKDIRDEEKSRLVISRLDVIHTLTNSAYTARVQDKFNSLISQSLLLRQLIAMQKTSGGADKDSVAQLEALNKEIQDTKDELVERAKQAKIVEKQLDDHKSAQVGETAAANELLMEVAKQTQANALQIVANADELKRKLSGDVDPMITPESKPQGTPTIILSESTLVKLSTTPAEPAT